MRARARLAAGALTAVTVLGGTVACSGVAPQQEVDEVDEGIGDGEGEDGGEESEGG